MKKLVLILSIIGLHMNTYAVKRSVSNNPNSPGQYNTLAAAITASNADDTLYVVGSPTDYGSVTINKKLTIIGSGYNPNKQNPLKTSIGSITISRTLISDPSSSKIIGIEFINITLTGLNSTNKLSGIVITRCRGASISCTDGANVSSAVIYNNIITGGFYVQFTSGTPFGSIYSVYNNIFYSGGIFNNTYNSGGALNVYNNLFVGTTVLSGCYYTNFYNNIFYGYSPYMSSPLNNSFYNNLSYGSGNDNFNLSGTNTGANNLAASNPSFVLAPVTAMFTYTNDYHLNSGSPALTAGTGSTQIGIYGGVYPFPNGIGTGFQTSACAPIPQIYEMNMQNPLIPTTGTLSVQIKARKVD